VRHTQALASELRAFGEIFGVRAELRGSLRAEWTQTAFVVSELGTDREAAARRFNLVERVALALAPLSALTLRGAYGTGRRNPAFLELFGDGGRVRPNEDLLPERGHYADVGLALRGSRGPLRGALEANGFTSWVDDKIVWISNAQGLAVARNLGSSEVRGVELGGEASVGRLLRVVSAATLMQTEDDKGLQLPRQPKLRVYGRLESSLPLGRGMDRLTPFVTLNHVSTAFLDTTNTVLRQPQTHLGLGLVLALFQDQLALQGRVTDVLDRRGQDYLKFPLPGRAYYVSLAWHARGD
jgi:outer membrane cobalamin receptor